MEPPEPVLRPPGAIPTELAPTRRGRPWVWIALAVVGALSLAVIFILPGVLSKNSGQDRSAAGATAEEIRAQAELAARRAAARKDAESGLQALLRARARLELANASVWGEPGWSQALTEAAAGDQLFGIGRFAEAAAAYSRALQVLQGLEGGRDARLAAALEAGRDALNSDDGATASTHFELALAIEPGHELALRELERARVRADVLERMEAGALAESSQDLEGARRSYAEAVGLDADYQPASANLERVAHLIAEGQFHENMSRALVALDAGRLAEAEQALDAAARLRPEAPALRDTQQRLAQAVQQAKLNALRLKADGRSAAEDWDAAIRLYKRALAIEPRAGFARRGLDKAGERRRLHEQLDQYLTNPARLYSAGPLANAEALVAAAGEVSANEPRLAKKIKALKRDVAAARTPVPVTLLSDGQTEVIIYRVARLGRFQEQRLELRPGTYTATGSRVGYRDVRQVFEVRPDAPPTTLDIRCREAI